MRRRSQMIDDKIKEIAERIRGLREMSEISVEEMAAFHGMTEADYIPFEQGEKDYSFTFLYKCANKLGVDVVEVMTGESPTLSEYTLVRKDQGLEVKRRVNFKYRHLAHLFKGKKTEPFVVTAPYEAAEEGKPIALSTHPSQEFDYILSGTLTVVVNGHTETLNAGDCIYYNSELPHGMRAVKKDCTFLAVVIK